MWGEWWSKDDLGWWLELVINVNRFFEQCDFWRLLGTVWPFFCSRRLYLGHLVKHFLGGTATFQTSKIIVDVNDSNRSHIPSRLEVLFIFLCLTWLTCQLRKKKYIWQISRNKILFHTQIRWWFQTCLLFVLPYNEMCRNNRLENIHYRLLFPLRLNVLTQVYCYYCVATEFMENPKVAVQRGGMSMEHVTDVANVWFIYMKYMYIYTYVYIYIHTYVG